MKHLAFPRAFHLHNSERTNTRAGYVVVFQALFFFLHTCFPSITHCISLATTSSQSRIIGKTKTVNTILNSKWRKQRKKMIPSDKMTRCEYWSVVGLGLYKAGAKSMRLDNFVFLLNWRYPPPSPLSLSVPAHQYRWCTDNTALLPICIRHWHTPVSLLRIVNPRREEEGGGDKYGP